MGGGGSLWRGTRGLIPATDSACRLEFRGRSQLPPPRPADWTNSSAELPEDYHPTGSTLLAVRNQPTGSTLLAVCDQPTGSTLLAVRRGALIPVRRQRVSQSKRRALFGSVGVLIGQVSSSSLVVFMGSVGVRRGQGVCRSQWGGLTFFDASIYDNRFLHNSVRDFVEYHTGQDCGASGFSFATPDERTLNQPHGICAAQRRP